MVHFNLAKMCLFFVYILVILAIGYGEQFQTMKLSLGVRSGHKNFEKLRKFFTITKSNVLHIGRMHHRMVGYIQFLNARLFSPYLFVLFVLTYLTNIYLLAHITQSTNGIEMILFGLVVFAQATLSIGLVVPIEMINFSTYDFVQSLNDVQSRQPNFGTRKLGIKLMTMRFAEISTIRETGNFGFTVGPICLITRHVVYTVSLLKRLF